MNPNVQLAFIAAAGGVTSSFGAVWLAHRFKRIADRPEQTAGLITAQSNAWDRLVNGMERRLEGLEKDLIEANRELDECRKGHELSLRANAALRTELSELRVQLLKAGIALPPAQGSIDE